MALMLCRLQKTTSESMSSRVIARPRFASNSWRSAPLNYDALAIERHNAVFDAECAEADLLRHGFDDGAVMIRRRVRSACTASAIPRSTARCSSFAGIKGDFAVAGLR